MCKEEPFETKVETGISFFPHDGRYSTSLHSTRQPWSRLSTSTVPLKGDVTLPLPTATVVGLCITVPGTKSSISFVTKRLVPESAHHS